MFDDEARSAFSPCVVVVIAIEPCFPPCADFVADVDLDIVAGFDGGGGFGSDPDFGADFGADAVAPIALCESFWGRLFL